ncbi:MAG: inositol monophosphatase family protein [Deltaproteobacteria bacterium]|nr:inositol monophosphatase family protein [Deltaproteobacteria bacterium]
MVTTAGVLVRAGLADGVVLRAVEQAVTEAGALIRAESHRPGGPRQEGPGHALVDREVELVLRDRLRALLPEAGYLGEELGQEGPLGEVFWCVDPQDGTAAFLRALRGSSVSVALVIAGEPVLGVVYAPCAPDDDGDCISWCEGQGLRRNGVEVKRNLLANSLSHDVMVAVSQDADGASEGNARACAPARFCAVVSIAYRMALCAVGEVDAAVSLAGVTWWDVAAGHALLRAVGGTLVDDQGTEVKYEQKPRAFDAFAGSLEVARALALRDWSAVRVRSVPDALSQRYSLVVGRRSLSHARWPVDPGVLARAQGCMLGQLAGDALGGLVEFRDAASIASEYPGGVRWLRDGGTWDTLAGQPTDDSEMALILARMMLAHQGYDVERAYEAYRDWLTSSPFDVGMTVRGALTGSLNPSSQANGALMRCAPLAIVSARLGEPAREAMARRDAMLTHPHEVCTDANALFVLVTARAIRTGETAAELMTYALTWARTRMAESPVTEALERAQREPPREYVRQQGWVLIALQNAFYQLARGANVAEGLIDTVSRGGDTDTNAAITGALLGAVYGREAVPLQWRRSLSGCRPIAGLEGVVRPRPSTFWPVDSLALAESLLTVEAWD